MKPQQAIEDFSVLDSESESESEETESDIVGRLEIIPAFHEAVVVTAEISPTDDLPAVRASDVEINNVQILSLLHGMQHVRTVNGLCKINEQISRTLRYRRDLMGMEREKPAAISGASPFATLPATPID